MRFRRQWATATAALVVLMAMAAPAAAAAAPAGTAAQAVAAAAPAGIAAQAVAAAAPAGTAAQASAPAGGTLGRAGTGSRLGHVPTISQAPAYPGDFPDPYVLRVGGTYWAYATGSGGRNLQVMSSTDPGHWGTAAPTDPLPVLPAWAQTGSTWAPSVIGLHGSYVMYYTVRDAAAGRQCISTASSPTPAGPFADTSTGPLVCQLDHGGSIDPNVFVSGSNLYLLWKSDDNAINQTTRLWSQPLTADGRSLVGNPTRLLTQRAPWQAPIIEGPAMVASGGTYYLFYGANNWDSAGAAIGYATCRSPVGPCVNASVSGPWMASHGAALGPSGPAFFTTATGTLDIAYHAWTGGVGYQNGGVRSLWVDAVTFTGGRPVLS